MDDHDGAIERAWRDGLKPDPLLTVSEWADRYRVLSQRASSEPGRWRTDRTPYARAAAAIYGLDRFEERHWRRMEEALAHTASPRAPIVRPAARQVIHSGYMAR